MSNITMGYINNKGEFFENIRNIKFQDRKPFLFGKFYTENKNNNNSSTFSDMDESYGVYIYKSFYDDRKALRIYKDFINFQITFHDDEKLVSELQKRQKNIKLTEFPTGIITIENKIIGQEIPYYDNHKTIKAEIEEIKDIKKLLLYYKQIIDIIEELLKNNIYYADLNTGNFLVKNDIIKLIDFESGFISFDGNYKYIINNLINLLKSLKKNLTIDFNFSNNSTIEEIREEINLKTKRLM